jgi:hypothetical protein
MRAGKRRNAKYACDMWTLTYTFFGPVIRLLASSNNRVNGFGHISNISAVESRNIDSPTLWQVDVIVVYERAALLRGQFKDAIKIT